ncbi:hypothetical protein LAV84_23840 [Rhizobium sp. VS19-DR104.2]|uniref:hypothetical protein n=1 Tax=unclassified Rhizobium TaxID=2613769 RepID=UPI001CC4242F|nr:MULTISPECIES: hypothetical protein [unclassified Rhizobium]MBZ5762292.1 hypothetical protein [Rhizobium sp. VS19-DR96]MBZ5768308.1 hypothetical protein [Rhizobium sp. VS19-DR129.2]MBZ5775820.1 hypothetical protein [Rhizobium sp. VS19-DRK62.2]MBZ5787159.1 hypothetical protein [Rhizobium sp. VS19-DR121]MBZ5804234.1 hypothetical protein [Rhizobium sp. VS19-DR181]
MLLKILAITGVAGAMVAPVALAEDASFGCQVLLCAASSNPSWPGVPYCVPVMHRLFDLLAAGHSWPTCPEGHASAPGYQPLEDCPTGTAPATRQEIDSGSHNSVGRYGVEYRQEPNGTYCAPPSELNSLQWSGRDLATVRQKRSDPYCVDITTANGTSRFWFSLNAK